VGWANPVARTATGRPDRPALSTVLAVLLLGAAGFLLAWPASSPADTTEAAVTPHNDTAAIFDVLSHKRAFATDRATLTLIEHTLESEHYDVRWYGKGGNAGPATLANFVKTVRAGVDIIDTHGTPDSLLVQQYATADAAQQGLTGLCPSPTRCTCLPGWLRWARRRVAPVRWLGL